MSKRKVTVATLHDQLQQMATKEDHSQLSGRVDTLSGKLDTLSGKFDALSLKVDALIDVVRNGFHDVNAQLRDLHNRVDTLHRLMENLLVRVERLEQEYTNHNGPQTAGNAVRSDRGQPPPRTNRSS